MKTYARVKELLERIYGPSAADDVAGRLERLIEKYQQKTDPEKTSFSCDDAFLITYGDSLQADGYTPLQVLRRFAGKYLKDVFSTIHILPFYPYSSDDGFSVIDYHQVDPALGSWTDVRDLREDFLLMFDYVLNHISAKSTWFDKYLKKEKGYDDLAIRVDPEIDLSSVVRPRALPLLTPFTRADGEEIHLWTTFSADQVDLNFESLDVLEKMVDVLLFYVDQGAASLRLDAVAYLWKKIGTSCIHLSQTHDMVRLFRAILDIAAPHVQIITETNVPHAENVSYFGNGADEAQMVYNFTLPPLLLWSFMTEDAQLLTEWAGSLTLPSSATTFFNFTASHDGIGVRPLEGIVDADGIARMAEMVKRNGGNVSYKQNTDGSQSPYELNIAYVDALKREGDTPAEHAGRFLASQAVQLVMPGVPATYIHSILGSRNWTEGVHQTGHFRTINREKLNYDNVEAELKDPESFRSQVFYPYLDMYRTRNRLNALHPTSPFKVLNVHPSVFSIKRGQGEQTLFALTNVSSRQTEFALPADVPGHLRNMLTGDIYENGLIRLEPFQFVWLSGVF